MKKSIQHPSIPLRTKVLGRHFYSHLIETDSLTVEIHSLDLTENEKGHLLSLIESSLHHTVLDVILSELSEEDKRAFLFHIAHDQHNHIWTLLNAKVDNIEEKIKKAAEAIKEELYKDINTAKEFPQGVKEIDKKR